MERDTVKIFSVLIVLGIILAGFSFFLVKPITDADRMVVASEDLDSGWREEVSFSPNYSVNTPYSDSLTSAKYVIMSNETSIIVIQLLVFNSTEGSLEWFHQFWKYGFITQDVEIGDSGYAYRFGGGGASIGIIFNGQGFSPNPSNLAGLAFIEGNTFASIEVLVKDHDSPTQPWIRDFVLELGMIQLQKIDRYSSH